MAQPPQVDFNTVVTKLQNRLADAMTTIVILEAQVEQLQELLERLEPQDEETSE